MPHPSDRRLSRRAFLGGARTLAVAPDAAGWAEVEARAARAGVVPGTRVDASGALLSAAARGFEPFLGEIMIVAFGYAPRGWALCNGQLLSIAQNTALFSLLGTTFGGNGQTTFALPDLRDRLPMHAGTGYALGQTGGSAAVTLSAGQMPQHVHTLGGAAAATRFNPSGAALAPSAPGNAYAAGPRDALASSVSGQGQPVANLPPYLKLCYCLSMSGIYPSRN